MEKLAQYPLLHSEQEHCTQSQAQELCKGMDKIYSHACDFIRDRVAPADPENDGKQTPMRGHPVFIAQHATATCCRGCIEKWHKFPQHRELTKSEQEYLVSIIMEWIKRQIS